jgi:hypothetical protein
MTTDATAEMKVETNSNTKGSIFKEIGYWLLFSVLVALAQLWLIPLAYYLTKKPFTLIELIGNGSLLFFATTTASKIAGEYFKKVKGNHEVATLLCVTVMLVIIFVSVFVYALEVASRLGGLGVTPLSPERVTSVSILLAISGLIFSFAYTLYIREYGE